nr:prolyl oligopeptidase family serine peptidase [Sinobaca sp. H24]
MTNWIVGHTNRFKAAVTQRSISNWLSFQGVSDIGFFFTEWELKKSLPGSPEELWNFSPLKYINHVSTPLLIMHGEQDFRCPIEQGEQLFIGLKKLGKTVGFLRFPHSNHELSRGGPPALRIHRLEYMAEWFNRYL